MVKLTVVPPRPRNDSNQIQRKTKTDMILVPSDPFLDPTPFLEEAMRRHLQESKRDKKKKVNLDPDYLHHGQRFIQAAEDGDIARIQALLAEGVDIEFEDGEYDNGVTALMKATEKGHTEVVKLLLNKGAKTVAKTTF